MHAGTRHFELRLIELLAVACHDIAVYLYNLDDDVHKHRIYEEWRDLPRDRMQPGRFIAPTAFYHRSYPSHAQYPNGEADMVGYWAEAKIFGGEVIFDRGDSGTEVSFHDLGRWTGAMAFQRPEESAATTSAARFCWNAHVRSKIRCATKHSSREVLT